MTPGFVVPLSEALNCWVWLGPSVTVDGDRLTLIVGNKVIVALAILVGSAALAAVKVTVCWMVTTDGAVYSPPDTVPTCGDIVQLTAVLVDPVTVAVN